MNLTPEIVSDILVRQGYITPEQGETIRQEAKAMPTRLRSSTAYEQKAVAYDLIGQLRLPNGRDSGAPITEIDIAQAIAGDAKLDHVRIDALNLNADLIESKMSRPFAKRHRMIPLDMA
jgi:general secretion pathway protein E